VPQRVLDFRGEVRRQIYTLDVAAAENAPMYCDQHHSILSGDLVVAAFQQEKFTRNLKRGHD
jgi:hypothetical protein